MAGTAVSSADSKIPMGSTASTKSAAAIASSRAWGNVGRIDPDVRVEAAHHRAQVLERLPPAGVGIVGHQGDVHGASLPGGTRRAMGSPALGRVFSPGAGRPAHRPPATPGSFADGPGRPGAWRAPALPRNRRSGRPCLRVPAPDHWPWRPRPVGSSRRTSRVRPRRRGRTASRSRSPSQASRDPSGGVRLQRPPHPRVAPGASHRGRRRTNSRREGRETSLARPVRKTDNGCGRSRRGLNGRFPEDSTAFLGNPGRPGSGHHGCPRRGQPCLFPALTRGRLGSDQVSRACDHAQDAKGCEATSKRCPHSRLPLASSRLSLPRYRDLGNRPTPVVIPAGHEGDPILIHRGISQVVRCSRTGSKATDTQTA